MATEPQYVYQDLAQRLFTLLNSNNVQLVPYAKVGDEWSLPDEFILSAAVQMQREGTFQKVFYAGDIKSPNDFLSLMQRPDNYPVFSFIDGEPVALGWINGMVGTIAYAHFCVFSRGKAKMVEIGRVTIAYWCEIFGFLRAILGLTPSNNRQALRFIKHLGFTSIGEVPEVLYDAYEGSWVGGTISYMRISHGR